MSFLTPLGLLFGLLAIPIIILYMLRLRRKEVEVSSTLLWQMLMRDRQANAPWQKLRRNLLLLIQLLILLLVVLALARPALQAPVLATGNIILILDGSASMQAVDVEPSRFSAALEAARTLINELGTTSKMTIILAGHQPRILSSSERDKNALREALENIQPSSGESDWEAAFALAAGAGNQENSEKVTFVIISDGGLPDEGLPPLPGDIQFLGIATEAPDNLAVSALALRSTRTGAELFISITNHGVSLRSANLTLLRNGEPFETSLIQAGGGETVEFTLTGLPDQAARYEARLRSLQPDIPLDALPLDDTGYAVFVPPVSQRILYAYQQQNFFITQILGLLTELEGISAAHVELDAVTPADLDNDFGIFIFDGVLPENLPPSNLLIINPPDNPLFTVQGTVPVVNAAVINHPLTEGISWDNVHVSEAKQVQLPFWASPLVISNQTPLLFAGELDGRRIAVINFDLNKSDLPLQVAFPVIFSNLLGYLTPAESFVSPQSVDVFEKVTIRPEDPDSQIQVLSPDGSSTILDQEPFPPSFSLTSAPGFYEAIILSGAPQTQQSNYFAVNLFSPAESSLLPKTDLILGTTTVSQTNSPEELGQQELWPWLAALGLLLLGLEWLVYHGRLSFRPR